MTEAQEQKRSDRLMIAKIIARATLISRASVNPSNNVYATLNIVYKIFYHIIVNATVHPS